MIITKFNAETCQYRITVKKNNFYLRMDNLLKLLLAFKTKFGLENKKNDL